MELELTGDQDFELYTSADATLRNAAGVTVASWTGLAIDEESIVLSIPVGSFETPGVYRLVPRLVGHGTVTLPGVPVIVEAADGWHSIDSARDEWPGAPEDLRLYTVLALAKEQVLAYAPVLEAGAVVPMNFRQAQLMQARNIWNSSKADPSNGQIGDGSFVITPFPLDWMVQQMLRPRRGMPAVGIVPERRPWHVL
ncbi:hypothetical protein [Curtobacterium sp. MCBD17_040]|uniref:hypothetical protein n=1 Tax=Curtobacterium sp. MCBD17_040 TaxID=2175674 RepID=UPI000DA95D96|nr:hypothetical protein [Curtobacterium sp. MCBD17_040]WIB64371.1 hypothetical protein DEI94_04020 [Curtobacterium sp. MCBD17_040]